MPYFDHSMATSIAADPTASMTSKKEAGKVIRNVPTDKCSASNKEPEAAPDEKITAKYKVDVDVKKLTQMKDLLKAEVEALKKGEGAQPTKDNKEYEDFTIDRKTVLVKGKDSQLLETKSKKYATIPLACRVYESKVGIAADAEYLKMLRHLGKKHASIAHTWGVFIDDSKNIEIIQGYASNGPLEKLATDKQLEELDIAVYGWQLLRGMDFMGDIGIVHRDISPKNIVLGPAKEYNALKIINFRKAVIYWSIDDTDISFQPCVAAEQQAKDGANYQAPEVYGDPKKEEFDPVVADTWSFGAVLFFMAAKKYPYDPAKQSPNLEEEIQGAVKGLKLADDGKELLGAMLRTNAGERIPIGFVGKSSWFEKAKGITIVEKAGGGAGDKDKDKDASSKAGASSKKDDASGSKKEDASSSKKGDDAKSTKAGGASDINAQSKFFMNPNDGDDGDGASASASASSTSTASSKAGASSTSKKGDEAGAEGSKKEDASTSKKGDASTSKKGDDASASKKGDASTSKKGDDASTSKKGEDASASKKGDASTSKKGDDASTSKKGDASTSKKGEDASASKKGDASTSKKGDDASTSKKGEDASASTDSKCAQEFLKRPRFGFYAFWFLSHHSGTMTSPKWVIDTPSTSTANQDPSEQKFSTIPLNDNGLEMVPIEMATIANETFSSAENVPPAPFLRGSSQQQNEDSIRFPHLPAVPRNVHKILNWFNRKPWIFPLSYCIVFCLILLLAIVLAWMNVKFWFFFPTIDNPKLEGLSHAFLPYFYVLVTIYAFLMALTGYARYCQLDYFLQCAAQKIEDQANSLTFPGRFPNIAYSTLLREKVVKYKKHNKETFSFLLVASLCQLILGNFSFGPFSIVYWISFFVYYVLIWTYCICMTIIMHFISQKFNYESFSLEMVAISIIGSVFGIVYVVILGAEIFFNPHFPSTLFAMLELISNFFFPAFSFITFLKMYKFPNWKNVRTF